MAKKKSKVVKQLVQNYEKKGKSAVKSIRGKF